VIYVDGKTGARPIRLVRSTPNLANWINVHPLRDNPEAPLWIDLGQRNYGSQFTYAAANTMLKRRCKKANLSKRVSLNLFRHSEATSSAMFMTEAQMRKRHGWSPESKMPARYVHLVNADVDQAILEHYGIKKQKAIDEKIPQICIICKNPNSFDSTICSQCGKPLDLEAAIQVEDEQNKLIIELKKAVKENQETKKKVKQILNHLKIE